MTLEQAEMEYAALLKARIVHGENVDVNRMRELQLMIAKLKEGGNAERKTAG
jgi:hypothetical protein